MPNIPLYSQQIQFMIDLAANRLEWLNPFFRFLNLFDTPYFFFIIVPLLWIGFSYRWGLRIYYWTTASFLINSFAKYLVHWPRPSTIIPDLGLIPISSHGFPSGGAQTAMFCGILLIYYGKTRIAWIVGSIYILLISFSRLYLGVHFPMDILGGWVIGAFLAFLFIKLKKPIDQFFETRKRMFSLLLPLLAAFLLAFVPPNGHHWASFMAGIGIGTYLSLERNLFLAPARDFTQGFFRGILGTVITMIFYFLWHNPFVAALFLSRFVSPICRRMLRR